MTRKDFIAGDKSIVAETIRDTVININASGTTISDEEATQRETQYLTRIKSDCSALKWLRQVHKEDDGASSQGLQSVYTALMTQSVEGESHQLAERIDTFNTQSKSKQMDGGIEGLFGENKTQLSALTVLNQCQKLVMTGSPGSGKSAFVDFLTLCLSGEALKDEYANLQLLTAPVPNNEGEPLTEEVEIEGEDENETREVRQPWNHVGLIPVRIILRDFSTSDYFPKAGEKADACHVLNFIESELNQTGCGDYFIVLRQRLLQGDALVMFDGLDEVPQAGDRRKRLLRSIECFTHSHFKCRVLVTCRPYAYQDKQWRLEGFDDTQLADFGRGQMIRFIRRWYEGSQELDDEGKQLRIEKLKNAVLNRENLTELARRPLLLSLIAYLHANRHDLPERRADLYERLLELLVDEWERVRFEADDELAARKLHQQSLAEFLHIGQDTIREVLERLAFKAHASQGENQQGTADISASDLVNELSQAARKAGKKIDAYEISEFLCDRVGILYQRGGANEINAVYTFPHRSFQEYLAASYFRRNANAVLDFFEENRDELGVEFDDESWQYIMAHLGKTDPDRWREVVVLLGGMKSLKDPDPVWDLLQELIEAEDYTSQQQAWGMRLAAEILAESLDRTNPKRKKLRTFETIQAALPALLGTTDLPARERVIIGNYLATIGDPRPEVHDIDAMPFCFVPKGDFWMGDMINDDNPGSPEETSGGLYNLSYDYWIAQHPVTVAQFRAFVDAENINFEYPNYLRKPDNTPMVAITQTEAMQYCEWLTRRWQADGKLSAHWRVTLANEPEWEKAARGGQQVLSEPLIRAADDNDFDHSLMSGDMSVNENPQRVYALGDEINHEAANYDSHIESVSAMGVYPLGASPYGCHDMSGNVWEWTRSEYGKYPFPAVGTEAWKEQEAKELSDCVLRGGAFNHDQGDVRCAIRGYLRPDFRHNSVGFRVVLSPLL